MEDMTCGGRQFVSSFGCPSASCFSSVAFNAFLRTGFSGVLTIELMAVEHFYLFCFLSYAGWL